MTRKWMIFYGVVLAVSCTWPLWAIDKESTKAVTSTDWAQWRGPYRDDISPDVGLLNQWPEEGPPLLWKREGVGSGYSSLAIDGDRILTTGDREGKQWVIALKRDGGDKIWEAEAGEAWDHDPNGYNGARTTPTIDGDRVYTLGPHGDLLCLNLADGKEIWRKNLVKDFGGEVPRWGYCESPLVDGNKVLVTPGAADAVIVALDKKTGKEIWRSKIPSLGDKGKDGAGYSSIVISNGAHRKQYVQLVGRGVVGIDASTGEFLWGYNRAANAVANIPTPLVFDDYVFTSAGYGAGAALIKLKATGSGVEAEEVYFLDAKTLQNHHGQMIQRGDYIYCGHGHNAGAPTCIEWMTGKIVWRENHGPGNGTAHVTFADGNLYFRFQNPGLMALVTATPEGYEQKGTFQIPGSEKPSWSHPVVIGGKLYLREQNTLFCYDVRQK
jgi:outer membrane protein assembly factor BamB